MPKISLGRLGRLVAESIAAGDKEALESAAIAAGTHRVLVAAAALAGVDSDELEEALGEI